MCTQVVKELERVMPDLCRGMEETESEREESALMRRQLCQELRAGGMDRLEYRTPSKTHNRKGRGVGHTAMTCSSVCVYSAKVAKMRLASVVDICRVRRKREIWWVRSTPGNGDSCKLCRNDCFSATTNPTRVDESQRAPLCTKMEEPSENDRAHLLTEPITLRLHPPLDPRRVRHQLPYPTRLIDKDDPGAQTRLRAVPRAGRGRVVGSAGVADRRCRSRLFFVARRDADETVDVVGEAGSDHGFAVM